MRQVEPKLEPVFHDPEKASDPRAALAALAAHLPILTTPGLVFRTSTPARPAGDWFQQGLLTRITERATALLRSCN